MVSIVAILPVAFMNQMISKLSSPIIYLYHSSNPYGFDAKLHLIDRPNGIQITELATNIPDCPDAIVNRLFV
jgi:hypothetical protein